MKLFKVLMALSVVMLLHSCSDEEISTIEREKTFDPTHSICPHEEQIETRQLSNVNGPGWTPCESYSLTVFIPDCLRLANEPIWGQAIRDGFNNINNIPGSSVNISTTIVEDEADIVLKCDDRSDCFGGEVDEDFVDDGMSDFISFNTGFDLANCGCTPGGLDLCSATFVVMHEMMHALGFFHNNSNHANATPVAGTPAADAPSVINGGGIVNFCALPCALSAFDILAIETIYPIEDVPCTCIDDVFLRGPNDLCIEEGLETGTVTLCVSPLPPKTSLFQMDGTPIVGNCVEYSYSELGTFTEEIQICFDNGGCCLTLSKSIVVFDDNCCATCYCECQELIDQSFYNSVSFNDRFTKNQKYKTVRHAIPCWDDTPCEELYPTGDELFDCERIVVNNELDLSIFGDEVLCWDEEGRFCILGLPSGTGVDWIIHGPNGIFSDSSSGNCLYITFGEIGTYTVTAEIFEGECSEVFSHTVEYKHCEQTCYCICEEGDGYGNYETVELPIDCEEDCDEIYPEGDEYFDCKKVFRDE